MAYLTLLITIPLTLFTLSFAISNGDEISLGLWPLEQKLTLPGWQFGLGFLGAGFLSGALFVWLLSQKTRFLYWKESRRAARLEKELGDLHAKTAPKDAPPAQAALPAK